MGRAPCCDKANVKRGPWSPQEDDTLRNYVETHGTGGNWITLPRKAGLRRCGKSCRLRWLNYLRADIKHGGFTQEENNIICALYNQMGSRWSAIASRLPGRTDNDVKNYWNTKLKKKLMARKTAHSGTLPSSSSLPVSTVASSGFNINSESMNPDLVQYSSRFMDVSEFGASSRNIDPFMSLSPESSSISDAPSQVLTDFGFGFPCEEPVNGVQCEEKVGEFGPSYLLNEGVV